MIKIKGACEHNLKNIDVNIPRNSISVVTGLSGSGKSSLAFDTVYAEGQRRYVESLSHYARQFLGIMKKPDVENIEGLSPAIVIEQRGFAHNPRSTVGTITEIYDYLRLLYARVGDVFCPYCDIKIQSRYKQDILKDIKKFPENIRLILLAPIISSKKGEHKKIIEKIQKGGFTKIKIDNEYYDIEEIPELDRHKKHTIQIVVDRIKNTAQNKERLSSSVELALNMGHRTVIVEEYSTQKEHLFSEHFACPECGFSLPEINPRFFSFNSPFGACPKCEGIGFTKSVEPSLIIDDEVEISRNPFIPFRNKKSEGYYNSIISSIIDEYNIPPDTKFKDLSTYHKNIFLYGTDRKINLKIKTKKARFNYETYKKVEGFISRLERVYNDTDSEGSRKKIEKFMNMDLCPSCNGARLSRAALAVRVGGINIAEFSAFSIKNALKFVHKLNLSKEKAFIAKQVFREVKNRLLFLQNVGLSYLNLDRLAYTLSGGEYQRIRLATQLGTGLTGVLYVLDEPSIGLHQKDNKKLLDTLEGLRNLGNTVLVVEHDEETIRKADYVVDMGPGAGIHGGEVVFSGNVKKLLKDKKSITAKYLRREKRVFTQKSERLESNNFIKLKGCRGHNLKNIDINIPEGRFVVVAGVSGSGKSTLINDTLYEALMKKIYKGAHFSLSHKSLEIPPDLKKVVMIDQMPIGKTPRSNPATYTGLFTHIRKIMTMTDEAKMRGYKIGRFSFNVKGGRCEICEGQGIKKIEMQFLPDVYIECEECKGARYNEETLEIKYRGKNIAQILDMTVEEALYFFENHNALKRKLKTLNDVGLSYMHLGQPATTLSGGEAQRVKLSTELSRVSSGDTLYILDEPTTGLHFDDVSKLLVVLDRLTARGNTVVVIEHNLDVIKFADYIIDLGPDGGEGGGELLYQGGLKGLKKCKKSYTSQALYK
ncbi:MAG: excinuclease ABC subunit UvrA [Candidatus Muiribacteriota bacterium]